MAETRHWAHNDHQKRSLNCFSMRPETAKTNMKLNFEASDRIKLEYGKWKMRCCSHVAMHQGFLVAKLFHFQKTMLSQSGPRHEQVTSASTLSFSFPICSYIDLFGSKYMKCWSNSNFVTFHAWNEDRNFQGWKIMTIKNDKSNSLKNIVRDQNK